MALLGNLKGSAHVFAETEFYNGIATQSLRFDSASTAYLYRTNSSNSNKRIFTWSGWLKKSVVFTSTATANQSYILSGGAAGGDAIDSFYFDAQNISGLNMNRLSTYWYMGNSSSHGSYIDYSQETDAVFRDVSAWYHIVLAVDTTQSTASNRVKYYVNGTLQTDTSQYYGQVPQNMDTSINNNVIQNIGRSTDVGNSRTFEGYMAEVNFVDGYQYDASYFGQAKNGVWIAKQYTGSYGTNGYRLEFKNTSVGSGSSSTIGADTSGNDNHWTSSGIAAHDCNIPDSPENNFTTLNSIYGNLSVTLSEGNLKYTISTSVNPVTGTISIPTTGKWYWEVYVSAVGDAMIGVQNRPDQQANGYSGRKTAYYREGGSGGGSGSIYIEGTGYGGDQASYTNGDVVSVLYNADDMQISWYVNGTQQGSTYTVTDTDVMPIVYQASSSGSTSGTFNFGQDSTFAGAISAGGNTDANGIGDFKYTVPSGYLALCTANLPEPTIGPDSDTQADDHFNTVLYTGNATDDRAVTGVGFQPDWIWIKNRTSSFTHVLVDSSRGLSAGYIASSTNNAESGDASLVKTITSDGFTLGTSGAVNGNSASLVSWNWKANGGTTSSDSNGSITSTVQANTDAGFSIVTYTGTGASNATIGHGLGAVPKQIWVKNRDASYNWKVYHAENTSAPETDYLVLDTFDATADSNTHWNDTAPTSTVFTIGSSNGLIRNNDKYVAYCFTDIEGYSKFGSVIGNGSTDGTFVYTGFRPAWIMVKCTTTTNDWFIYDIMRDTFNVVENILAPNLSNAESGVNTPVRNLDILSNGFKARGNDGFNLSGQTHIYMAFAEAPFKYANAR